MFRKLSATLLVSSALAAPMLGGCKITAESLVKYTKSPETTTVAYEPGDNIHIDGANGEISVVPGSGDDIVVSFTRFTMDGQDFEDEARASMEHGLELTASDDGSEVIIRVKKLEADGYLGADIRVEVPPSFNADFFVSQGNGGVNVNLGGTDPTGVQIINDGGGSIDLANGGGTIEIQGSAGDINVGVSSWGTANGLIQGGAGDVTFSAPDSFDGVIKASADDLSELTYDVPDNWEVEGSERDKTFTVGEGGIEVRVSSDLGDIHITTN